MTTRAELWPSTTGYGNLNGTYSWTLMGSAGYSSLFVSNLDHESGSALPWGRSAVKVGDETTTYREWGRCEAILDTVDHEVSVIIGPIASAGIDRQVGVCARFDASATTCYGFYIDALASLWRLVRWNAGTATSLGTAAGTLTLGQTVALRVTGTAPAHCVGSVNGTPTVTVDDTSAPLVTGVRGGLMLFLNRFDINYLGLHGWTASDVTVDAPSMIRQIVYYGA